MIAGWSKLLLPVVVLPDVGYKAKFQTRLELSTHLVDVFFRGDLVDMVRFIDYFWNWENKSISLEHRFRVLAFCLLN